MAWDTEGETVLPGKSEPRFYLDADNDLWKVWRDVSSTGSDSNMAVCLTDREKKAWELNIRGPFTPLVAQRNTVLQADEVLDIVANSPVIDLIWDPETDAMAPYSAARHVHSPHGACLKSPDGKACR